MIIGLTGNYRKKRFYDIINEISPIIVSLGHTCFVSSDYMIDEYTDDILVDVELLDFNLLVERSDIILSISDPPLEFSPK